MVTGSARRGKPKRAYMATRRSAQNSIARSGPSVAARSSAASSTGRLRPVLEAALERAATLGPDRAMLFCAERRVAMYARFGFHRLADPVTIDRPGGGTWPFPDVTMWRPLRPGVEWPAGPVRLHGLPF